MKAKDLNEVLDQYLVKDYNKYYLVKCPECGSPEAFMYKDNLNLIKCNRDNVCGAITNIEYENEVQDKGLRNVTEKKYDVELLKSQRAESKIITDFINYFEKNENYDSYINEIYRGLSTDAMKTIELIKTPESFQKFMDAKSLKIAPEMNKILKMNYYNLMIPVRNENGKIERIIFRSTKNNEKMTKAIQKNLVTEGVSARSFLSHNVEDSKNLFICESPIDAASIYEVNKEIGFISSLSTSITHDMQKYIRDNVLFLSAKESIVLAFDNDIAGDKAAEKVKAILNEIGVPKDIVAKINLGIYNDPNEALQKNREEFTKMVNDSMKTENNELNEEVGNDVLLVEIDYNKLKLEGSLLKYVDEKKGINRPINREDIKLFPESTLKFMRNDMNEKDLKSIVAILKTDKAVKQIESELNKFDETDTMKDFLDYTKDFPNYSQRNRMLLKSQNCTLVKSYNAWKSAGYFVTKGAKASNIFAPNQVKGVYNNEGVFRTLKSLTDQEMAIVKSNDIKIHIKTFYKLVPVFDISQTNIPKEEYPEYLKNTISLNQPTDQLTAIKNLATSLSLEIKVDNLNSAGGTYDHSNKTITLNTLNNDSENVRVLLHELGHAVAFNQYENMNNIKFTVEEMEVHAEGIAYLTADYIGVDTLNESTKYISGYSYKDKELFNKHSDFIIKCSNYLTSKINEQVELKQELVNENKQAKEIEQLQQIENEHFEQVESKAVVMDSSPIPSH